MANHPTDHEQKLKLKSAFDAAAEGYDCEALRFFRDSARLIPGFLGLKGDERVLDVAAGTGNAAIEIAAAIPNGFVTGIDFSEGMLAVARKKAEARAIENVEFFSMDMQTLEFPPEYFDAAVFAFSIFFVEDMEALLKHVVSRVRPGGKIIATSFASGAFSPEMEMFLKTIGRYGVETPANWKRFYQPEECIGLMQKAGLKDSRSDERDLSYNLKDANQWWDIVWNAGLRKFVAALTPSDCERFKEEHLAEVASLATPDGIRLEMKILFSQGVV
ncbi:MAG: methyltransferase domain-containing protein [Deltaproteobacteria bacterium]|nr:methyltransferase domain-containing protein [Deltaproteobacteria bacterium]